MPNYAKHLGVSRRSTPQIKPAPGKQMVPNDGGGFSFAIDCWTRLNRFLVMGCEGGHFQVSEKTMTVDNAKAVYDCIAENPHRAVTMVVELSHAGRAPKNDSSIFALAIMASDSRSSAAALAVLDQVCRIPTHLFMFLGFCKELRGWGQGLKKAVARWYLDQPVEKLALHITKYQNREGYSHHDVLRLSHPTTFESDRNSVFAYIAGKVGDDGLPLGLSKIDRLKLKDSINGHPLSYIAGFEAAKRAKTDKQIIQLIRNFNLVREHIPTHFLNSPAVWEALLQKMPPTAMIRNLGKMSSIGLVAPLSAASRLVCQKLSDADALKNARVHPFSLLLAQTTYAAGEGFKGENTWRPVQQVTDALEAAFYDSFNYVIPTGKNHYLAIDVSGSMSWPESMIAKTHIHAREGAACMAMVALRTEPNTYAMAFSNGMQDLGLSKSMSLNTVVDVCENAHAGGTNCAAPIIDALERRIPVDAFVIYTDNDTNSAQSEHPFQALQRYRQHMGIGAKLIVVSMCANGHSIADPSDSGSLDVSGFDANTPSIITEFVRG